jgi:hypothetical protein
MSELKIRIISRPAGGVPESIRDHWIGLVMPARKTDSLLADVMTRRLVTDRVGGYAVSWEAAMDALGEKSASARQWWEDFSANRACPFKELIFARDCCEVIPD